MAAYKFKPSTFAKKVQEILTKSGVNIPENAPEKEPSSTKEKEESEEKQALNQFNYILKEIRKDPDYPEKAGRASVNWFRDKIKSLGSVTEEDILADDSRSVTSPRDFIGKLFFFQYTDPKYKKVLPYWDAFPLVFPIDANKNTFLGLNMHYLDYNLRFTLFNKLLDFATDPRLTPKTKMQMTYGLLKNTTKYREFKPTLHKYLWNRVDSNFIRVSAPDWKSCLFMPVANFQKKTENFVWRDSKRKF